MFGGRGKGLRDDKLVLWRRAWINVVTRGMERRIEATFADASAHDIIVIVV